jgi:hypothetical protein
VKQSNSNQILQEKALDKKPLESELASNSEFHLGSYKNNDTVKTIITLRKDEFIKQILFKVEWEQRPNGYVPDSTWVINHHLKQN